MTCPKCGGEFNRFKHRSTKAIFYVCEDCKAVWFEKNHLWKSLESKEPKRQFRREGMADMTESEEICPGCQKEDRFLQTGILPMTNVTAGYCPKCKSFLFSAGRYKAAKEQWAEAVLAESEEEEVTEKAKKKGRASHETDPVEEETEPHMDIHSAGLDDEEEEQPKRRISFKLKNPFKGKDKSKSQEDEALDSDLELDLDEDKDKDKDKDKD